MDRCTGCRDITDLLLKTALNTIQPSNQPILTTLKKIAFENISVNGGSRNQQMNFAILATFNCCLQNVWTMYKSKILLFGKELTLYHTISTLRKRPFENIVGKGENAVNQHFLRFPQCFLPYQNRKLNFTNIWFVVCKCSELGPVQQKLSSGTELMHHYDAVPQACWQGSTLFHWSIKSCSYRAHDTTEMGHYRKSFTRTEYQNEALRYCLSFFRAINNVTMTFHLEQNTE